MRHYILIFLALLLGSKELFAGLPHATVPLPTSTTYSDAQIDGDYIAAIQDARIRTTIVVHTKSTGKTTSVDYGNSEDYCEGSLDANVTDPYNSAAGIAECAAFSCSAVTYSSLDVAGDYLVFIKSSNSYTCYISHEAYYLTSTTSSSSIGVYDLTTSTLSTVSATNPSALHLNDSSVIWIEDGKKVNMYDASTATQSTLLK